MLIQLLPFDDTAFYDREDIKKIGKVHESFVLLILNNSEVCSQERDISDNAIFVWPSRKNIWRCAHLKLWLMYYTEEKSGDTEV